MARRDPEGLLPLTPVALNVLLALADEERHGYGIILEVEERTGGEVRLEPGTVYGVVKRLREGDLIEESEQRPDPTRPSTTSAAAITDSRNSEGVCWPPRSDGWRRS